MSRFALIRWLHLNRTERIASRERWFKREELILKASRGNDSKLQERLYLADSTFLSEFLTFLLYYLPHHSTSQIDIQWPPIRFRITVKTACATTRTTKICSKINVPWLNSPKNLLWTFIQLKRRVDRVWNYIVWTLWLPDIFLVLRIGLLFMGFCQSGTFFEFHSNDRSVRSSIVHFQVPRASSSL